jgi:hypothetical protein
LVVVLSWSAACGSKHSPQGVDRNDDTLADDLGKFVDGDGDGHADDIDIDHDGKLDGPGVDTDDDGVVDALALDSDCDGLYDSLDTSGDKRADWITSLVSLADDGACPSPVGGGTAGRNGAGGVSHGGGPSGGSSNGGSSSGGKGGTNSGGSASGGSHAGGVGGAGASGSSSTGGEGGGTTQSLLGRGVFQGTGSSDDRFAEGDVYRDGVGYKFIANGWGDGWKSHQVSWNGTSFEVASLAGNQSANYAPAGYPSVFCGLYSEPPKRSPGECGLPKTIDSIQSLKTGWRWTKQSDGGQYNAAWDIWLGNGESLSSYLMVWLRDPPGQQPAGAASVAGASVPGLPGSWNIWVGEVNGHPIVNYVQAEGHDLSELEFDVLDVYADAKRRKYALPGSHVIAVAVGFEAWNGPIANVASDDFYVDVR